MTKNSQLKCDRIVIIALFIVVLILSLISCGTPTKKIDSKKIDSVMTCGLTDSGKPIGCKMERRPSYLLIDKDGEISISGDTMEVIKFMYKNSERDQRRLILADTIIRQLIKEKYQVFNKQM